MTIEAGDNRKEYSGNGVTTAFTTPFFLADEDLVVVLVDSDGVETVQTLNTHYTLSGAGSTPGGTCTMVTAPASGEKLVIYQDPAITQTVDLVENDPLPVETAVEDPLDKLTLIARRLKELVQRSLRLPDGDTGFGADDMKLPNASTRASKYLAFDANGVPMAASVSPGVPPTSAFMATVLDDENAAAARATLGALLPSVANITALKALSGTNLTGSVYMLGRTTAGDGGQGIFRWVSGDQSANVTSDSQAGIWVPPDSDATGASGAWKRQFSGSVNVSWFGTNTTPGTTDMAAAIRAAIAAAANNQVGTIEFPDTAYLLASQAVQNTTLANGTRFIATAPRDGLDSANGVLIKYTGSDICFDIRQPNGTAENGNYEFEGFTFQCTDVAGGMFAFNFFDAAGNTYTPTNDSTTPNFLRNVQFRNCRFVGAAGGATQTGDAIKACKTFHIVTDAACEFRGWRRGVYLKGCDNCSIDGRFVSNARHIMIEALNTFGNDNLILSRYVGVVASESSEDRYQIYDAGQHTTIIAPDLEDVNGLTAHLFLNGERTTIVAPDFGGGNSPLWELGADAAEVTIITPKLSTSIATKTPVYATPTSWDFVNSVRFFGITLIDPDLRTVAALTPHPRLRIRGGMNDRRHLQLENWHDITSNGIAQRRFVLTPFNYWAHSKGAGLEAIDDIVDDTGGFFGFAIQTSLTNLSGARVRVVVGDHINEGDTVRLQFWYRMSQIPTTGTLRWSISKNAVNVTNGALPNSTTYVRHAVTHQLSGFSAGDTIDFGFYNAASDAKLLVAYMLVEVLDPAETVSADNGDASATLTVGSSAKTQRWDTALTADRAVTLSTTGAANGDKFHIVRTANATGAFALNVGTGPLKALAAGEWCDVEFDGSAWVLTAAGSL